MGTNEDEEADEEEAKEKEMRRGMYVRVRLATVEYFEMKYLKNKCFLWFCCYNFVEGTGTKGKYFLKIIKNIIIFIHL